MFRVRKEEALTAVHQLLVAISATGFLEFYVHVGAAILVASTVSGNLACFPFTVTKILHLEFCTKWKGFSSI